MPETGWRRALFRRARCAGAAAADDSTILPAPAPPRLAVREPRQVARRVQKSTDALIFTKRGCRTPVGRSHVVVTGEKVWLYVRTALELAML